MIFQHLTIQKDVISARFMQKGAAYNTIQFPSGHPPEY